MSYFLYILECIDGTYYSGITTNLPMCVKRHRAGTASDYTAARGPVGLVHSQEYSTRRHAELALEAINKMSVDAVQDFLKRLEIASKV